MLESPAIFDRTTMFSRLEFFIFSCLEHLFTRGFVARIPFASLVTSITFAGDALVESKRIDIRKIFRAIFMRLMWVVQVPAASLLHDLIGRLSRLLLLSTQVRISDRHLIGWITLVDVEILPAAVFATRPLVPIPHALDLHEDRIAHAFGARVKTGWDKEGVELAAFGVVLAVE